MLSVNELIGFGSGSEHGHRYWRIYFTGADSFGGFQRCAELEMRVTAGGVDHCTGGTASASVSDPSYPAAYAFDNNAGTSWVSGNYGAGQTLQYAFAAPVDVAQISYLASPSFNLGPTGLRLEWSDSGLAGTWTAAQSWTPSAWNAGVAQVFNV